MDAVESEFIKAQSLLNVIEQLGISNIKDLFIRSTHSKNTFHNFIGCLRFPEIIIGSA